MTYQQKLCEIKYHKARVIDSAWFDKNMDIYASIEQSRKLSNRRTYMQSIDFQQSC